jgi:hypothetical protein
MTDAPTDRTRADSCPYCGAPHPRRMPPETHRHADGSISILAYCARCAGGWAESYRLDRVELLRPGRSEAP